MIPQKKTTTNWCWHIFLLFKDKERDCYYDCLWHNCTVQSTAYGIMVGHQAFRIIWWVKVMGYGLVKISHMGHWLAKTLNHRDKVMCWRKSLACNLGDADQLRNSKNDPMFLIIHSSLNWKRFEKNKPEECLMQPKADGVALAQNRDTILNPGPWPLLPWQ